MSASLTVEYQCPQCGAPALLEETDHLFSCAYCRVRSFLSSRTFRYVIPHNAPSGKELVYLPYWRFKGLFFTCSSPGVRHRLVDLSFRAQPLAYVPHSLGLRSQTLKLRFLTPETEGRFLKPTLGREDVLQGVEQRMGAFGHGSVYAQSFIGETVSQIYAPFYLENRFVDAVLNEPVSTELPEEFDLSALPQEPARWRLRFLPALCPGCGWDLEGRRDSIALGCRNCQSLWHASGDRFVKLRFAHLVGEGEAGEIEYLPFWRIRAEVEGVDLGTYADLVRLANLPRVVQKPWEDLPFRFWIPAFKIRPRDFLRCSSQLTLGQPRESALPRLPPGTSHPVTLPVPEAVESLKLVLAGFLKPERTMLPRLPEIRVAAKSFSLLYVPFRSGRTELIQDSYQMCISKNVLAHARHL